MSHSPDVVVITGDWMTRTDYDLSPYTKCLEALRGHPLCFGSFGNHDGKYWNPHRKVSAAQALELQLKELGIRFLVNDSQVVRVQDSDLRIVGLGDLWKHETWPERCMSSMEAKDMPTLLLSHNPDSKSEVRNYGWDVMFSGHTHGGQLKIPIVNWRPILPVEDKSMVEGIYAWENRHIHITRGVGCLHGMRINCPPEVSLVDLS
jgi:predicted MPP superfamily phosphohydrolase